MKNENTVRSSYGQFPKSCVLCGYENSTAQGYTVFYGYSFELLTGEEPVKPETVSGDLNGDGLVNLKDVVLIRRYIAGGWGVTL